MSNPTPGELMQDAMRSFAQSAPRMLAMMNRTLDEIRTAFAHPAVRQEVERAFRIARGE